MRLTRLKIKFLKIRIRIAIMLLKYISKCRTKGGFDTTQE